MKLCAKFWVWKNSRNESYLNALYDFTPLLPSALKWKYECKNGAIFSFPFWMRKKIEENFPEDNWVPW